MNECKPLVDGGTYSMVQRVVAEGRGLHSSTLELDLSTFGTHACVRAQLEHIRDTRMDQVGSRGAQRQLKMS